MEMAHPRRRRSLPPVRRYPQKRGSFSTSWPVLGRCRRSVTATFTSARSTSIFSACPGRITWPGVFFLRRLFAFSNPACFLGGRLRLRCRKNCGAKSDQADK
jgi:hypothetical protein